MRPINPESLGAPKGYSNGMLTEAGARVLFVAGQIGWDGQHRFVSSNFAEQFEQALRNVLAVVREAGGGPEQIACLRLYVVDRQEYLAQQKEIGAAYRRQMGRHYPAMALVEVRSLLESEARVEVEAMAAI